MLLSVLLSIFSKTIRFTQVYRMGLLVLEDLKNRFMFTKIEPIHKGWSNDKKYHVTADSGQRLLLRTSQFSDYTRKKFEFNMMQKVATLGIPMSEPLEFGTYANGQNVYSLFTWCEGDDAELVLTNLEKTDQYNLGIKAGKYLRLIHTISTPPAQEDWEMRFGRKARNKIETYALCEVKFPGDHYVVDYLEANWDLLRNRPQCFQHGDYHVGNMVISKDKVLSVIDFNRCDYGDPWEEFNRIVFSAEASPYFATGQVNGYFGGEPPLEFFKLLAFYIASNTLSAIPWAVSFGEKEIATMKKQARAVLTWYDNMTNPVPSWYLKDF